MLASLALLLAIAAPPELRARAQGEQKPIVVFFRTADCPRCDDFESITVPHPTIERRLPKVVFGVALSGEAGVALFDRAGNLRARWPIVPDTTNFGIILDSVATVAPHFERALQLPPGESALEVATALGRLGRVTDARAALAVAREHGTPETKQAAAVMRAVLDANDGKGARVLRDLEQIAANALTPKIAAEAKSAIEAIQRGPVRAPAPRGPIRILPLGRQIVSGTHTVRTHVVSASVARVAFALDGREVRRVDSPPFSATLDFGPVPERHAIRVTAYDRKGREIGRDERVVNEAGETFWLRIATPVAGAAGGRVRVAMNVRVPAVRRVRRVVLSWNDVERAVLTGAPWETAVDIPSGQLGILRAVAELDDGRTSEDAVLLNALGFVGQTSVQLVELPITVTGGASLTPDSIIVREGNRRRPVEAIATAAETPLTVGLLIDVSDSMQKTLPDLQEAAMRFLRTALGERDRAFLVTFDSYARLLQPATSDLPALEREIMRIRPDGLTALHDAMVLGLLQFEGINGRRAMIVFSDGLDRTSHYRASEVSELARRVNVPIHAIESVPDEPTDGTLKQVARSTGGTSHTLAHLGELPDVYARIEAALRAQLLAFIRTDPATRGNEWRPIRVEVQAPNAEVYAPEGYYATW